MALGELAGEPLIVAITAGGCLMVSSVEGEEIRGNIFDSLPAELRQPVNSLTLAETAVRSDRHVCLERRWHHHHYEPSPTCSDACSATSTERRKRESYVWVAPDPLEEIATIDRVDLRSVFHFIQFLHTIEMKGRGKNIPGRS